MGHHGWRQGQEGSLFGTMYERWQRRRGIEMESTRAKNVNNIKTIYIEVERIHLSHYHCKVQHL